MVVRIGINGFGRIGRMVLKAGFLDPDIEWVAVNDLTDTKTLAHLFKYDSVQGRWPGTVEAKEHSLVIDGKEVLVLSEKDPSKLPWKKLHADIVVESTGFFCTKEGASLHLAAGAKKVLISAPAKGPEHVKTVVKGVNEHELTKDDTVVSNASCTTNCLAPMVKVLHDNFAVKRGFMSTTHAYTADQRLVDSPHKDLRRARAAGVNLVPTSTGAAKAVGLVIPALQGKLDGFSIRAPVPCGSIVNFVCEVGKKTNIAEVNQLFKNVAEFHLKGILEYSEEPLVSQDIIHNSHSCILDAHSTNVIDGTLVNVVGWYDNEWGFSCRMVDVAKLMGKKI